MVLMAVESKVVTEEEGRKDDIHIYTLHFLALLIWIFMVSPLYVSCFAVLI